MWLTDNEFRIRGNAKDAINPKKNKLPEGWKIVLNRPSTVPRKGWIAVLLMELIGNTVTLVWFMMVVIQVVFKF